MIIIGTRLPVALILAFVLMVPAAVEGQDTLAPRRLRILVTNDDGFQAPGLRALAESLFTIADITVVAPYEQQSGTGHGISFRTRLTSTISATRSEFPGTR